MARSTPLLATTAAALLLSYSAGASPKSFGIGKSQIVLQPGVESSFLNYTVRPGSPGAAVTFWWLTGDAGASGQAGVDFVTWSFYVDGEATPSVSVQTSQAAFVGNADHAAPWSNSWFGKNSKFGGWHLNIPVPFVSSVRVTLTLPSWWVASERIFAMARGVDGLPIQIGSFVLPPHARLVASVKNDTLAPFAFHDLITLPAGTSGLMLGTMIDLRLYGTGAGGTYNLEGCWHAYSPPDTAYPGFLLGTGAEDYPESAFYFNAGPYRSETAGLTVWDLTPELALVSFYKLHHHDPYFFDDGFRFQWRNGDTTDPATGQKCINIAGNSAYGSPSYANVSTLVYAYTWPSASV